MEGTSVVIDFKLSPHGFFHSPQQPPCKYYIIDWISFKFTNIIRSGLGVHDHPHSHGSEHFLLLVSLEDRTLFLTISLLIELVLLLTIPLVLLLIRLVKISTSWGLHIILLVLLGIEESIGAVIVGKHCSISKL